MFSRFMMPSSVISRLCTAPTGLSATAAGFSSTSVCHWSEPTIEGLVPITHSAASMPIPGGSLLYVAGSSQREVHP